MIPKKDGIQHELIQANGAIAILGGKIKSVPEVTIKGLEQHLLVVLEKTSTTPPAYPRRPGMPTKRPLH